MGPGPPGPGGGGARGPHTLLGNPDQRLADASYSAALFWVYLCQNYGVNPVEPDVEPELGLDFLATFWDESDSDPNRDGIQVIDIVGYVE